MTRQPVGNVNGVSLRHYHPDRTYDLPSHIAEYLVIQGFALIEMRTAAKDRRRDRRRSDRRRQKILVRFRGDGRHESQ